MLSLKKITKQSVITWIDEYLLFILAGFLLAFIPLYPKIPLADLIPGYIVRMRLEDVFVLFTFLFALLQVYRGKIKWKTPITYLVIAYCLAGILSILSGLFVIRTIPVELLHFGKSTLHLLRYFEYFTLFFIVFSSIKSKKNVNLLVAIFSLTVIAISIYGFGQKYYYWPVYSTMNREFSKGLRLVLTEHARVQSTFGGHYDFAAYLVISLPVILALSFSSKKWYLKLGLYISFLFGVWGLVLSASRASFGAYLVCVTAVILLAALKKPQWWRKIWWAASRYLLVMVSTFIIIAGFGKDLYDRFLQVLEIAPIVHDTYHTFNRYRKDFTEDTLIAFNLRDGGVGFLIPKAEKPKNAVTIDEVLVASDERPVPADVYVDVPDKITVATVSATGETTTVVIEKPRTYSDTANRLGLSWAIRTDTLWPQAIAGFMKNPLVGSGYATLNKESVAHFTEAESTDNNYLRTLGETGILGFVTFYGIVVVASWYAIRLFLTEDNLAITLGIGFISATIGLLINAIAIDVFAASKVAFTYWGMAGIVIGYFAVIAKTKKKPRK